MSTTAEPTTKDLAALLPPVPSGTWGDGYDWMEQLTGGWRELAGLSPEQLLGEWPYLVVAVCDKREAGVYGIATYTEGDIEVFGYRDRAQRRRELETYVRD